jgi:hypothetical protein
MDRATSLRIYLIGPVEDLETGIEIGVFNPSRKYWMTMDGIGGRNKVEEPDNYVYKSGDVLIQLRNTTGDPIMLENFGITLRLEIFGTRKTFSYRDDDG